MTHYVILRMILVALLLTAGSISGSYIPLKAFYYKCGREVTEARVQKLEITGNNSFSIVYRYEAGGRQYFGNRLFDDEIEADRAALEALRAKVMRDSLIEAYYTSGDPSSSIAFLDQKAIAFPHDLIGCAVFAWIFLGGLFIRANHIDKEGKFRFG